MRGVYGILRGLWEFQGPHSASFRYSIQSNSFGLDWVANSYFYVKLKQSQPEDEQIDLDQRLNTHNFLQFIYIKTAYIYQWVNGSNGISIKIKMIKTCTDRISKFKDENYVYLQPRIAYSSIIFNRQNYLYYHIILLRFFFLFLNRFFNMY